MRNELPKMNKRQYLIIARKIFGMHMKHFTLYPASLITDVVGMAVSIATPFFIAVMTGDTNPLGADYFPFILIGMIANRVLAVSLHVPYGVMSGLYWSANIETMLLSPAPLWLNFLANLCYDYMFSSIYLVIFIFLGLLFGFQVNPSANLVGAFAVIGLSAVTVLGFGFLAASMLYLLEAKAGGNPITWAMGFLINLVSGLYYPVSFLPLHLQLAALALPHTYAYDGLRRALMPAGAVPDLPMHGFLPLDPLSTDLLVLASLCLIIVPLGWWLVKKGIERARLDGTLTSWV